MIDRVNEGLSTILRGVGTLRLSEILRGSFVFTSNQNVRDVANNVIDNIFGKRDESAIARNVSGLFPLRGL